MAIKGKKYNRNFTPAKFIDKTRSVDVEDITLKVRLKSQDFMHIKKKLDEKELHKFVDPNDSIDWINRCIVGKITKPMLDK